MSGQINIQKWKVDEQIRKALLQTRGDVVAVAKQLSLEIDYVKLIAQKFRKQVDIDVKRKVADNILVEIWTGHQARITYLVDMLNALREREQLSVSVCCDMPFREEIDSNGTYNVCLRCSKACNTHIVDRARIFEIKREILADWRDEDDKMATWAAKMGYTQVEQPKGPEVVQKIQQNVLVVGKDITEEGKQLLIDASQMSPTDRQKLRQSLERRVLELEAEEAKEEEKNNGPKEE